MFKTYSKKQSEVERRWVLVDAAGLPIGRLASFVATRLAGKYQPSYTAHIDSGDHVVVINADQAWLTGNKYKGKSYFSYSGYHGGISETTPKAIGKAAATERAIRGMLPKNKLLADRMKRLHVYADADHPHAPQQPETLVIASGTPPVIASEAKQSSHDNNSGLPRRTSSARNDSLSDVIASGVKQSSNTKKETK